ncbi:MAG: 23S rRNA (uracil(1939)-C(5))-methyltransferase RlmD [Elusimicrobia bacterium]|nr:23S rRNA (uracil(1939)-C(5))-methyltransferase RlmD [Elusimicrobiota bacterium]
MSASSSSVPKPRCRHFGACGGCQLQDLSYEQQLLSKSERVERLLKPLGVPLGQARPAPQAWQYRNKMEFSFGDVYPPAPGGPALKLGLKPQGRWYEILDLSECFLLSEETPGLLESVRRWAVEEGLPPFNSRRRVGLLRHLVLREGKNSGERMVVLVTSPGDIPRQSFIDAVLRAYPATTIVRGVNGKASDTAVCDRLAALLGPGFIFEELRLGGRRLRYRISPQSFFQTNTGGAEALYSLLLEWAGELGPRAALDLYCGGGGIALALAGVCGKVYGAELNAAAVEDARANAELNAIANAGFFTGSVETLLPSLLALGADLAVVDPPRAGLHPAAVKALAAGGPPSLLYVSCNPESLARDLGALAGHYSPRRAAVLDLFPQTRHVETVVQLDRTGSGPSLL